MKFNINAAFPMLRYDNETLGLFVDYMLTCRKKPDPIDLYRSTGIPLEICEKTLSLVLYINGKLCCHSCHLKKRELIDYLDD